MLNRRRIPHAPPPSRRQDALRYLTWFYATALTACTALLGAQDVPTPAGVDGSGADASADAAAPSVAAPSCDPRGDGRTSCGPSGSESCCTSLKVAGGMFK